MITIPVTELSNDEIIERMKELKDKILAVPLCNWNDPAWLEMDNVLSEVSERIKHGRWEVQPILLPVGYPKEGR